MSKNINKLVIVESPAKANTIEKFLGKNFKVKACMGHVRDLPKSELGVDIEHNFEPHYIIPTKSRKIVNELKKEVQKANVLYLATDLDREGEAIAWHLVKALGLDQEARSKNQESRSKKQENKTRRIVFNQITENAVKEAIEHPRDIDINLVNAQQARRILDRLVGYKLSPFLWKKVKRGLSAGRVQSVAVRLIVEREREIQTFKPEEYWEIIGKFKAQKSSARSAQRSERGAAKIKITDQNSKLENPDVFSAKLLKKDDKELKIENREQVDFILKDLEKAEYVVSEVRKKEKKRNPAPPFITSTLQQEASRKLGFSAKRTMMIAQQLYEGIDLGKLGHKGLITYMRTDSVNLAPEAVSALREIISKEYGSEYLPEKFNIYKAKKGAQEAHEAIRPTHPDLFPEKIKEFLDPGQFKLYSLIWKRAIACQMKPAVFDTTSIDIIAKTQNSTRLPARRFASAGGPDGQEPKTQNLNATLTQYLFRATGSIVKFDGFMKVYLEGKDTEEEEKEELLPELKKDEKLDLLELLPEQKFTQPPPRYSEASLVKELEKHGIGRPSTYAPIISTIQERGYVVLENRKFVPQEIGFIVNDVLVKHFPRIVDIEFTAHMEEELDEIAEGKEDWHEVIQEFWGPFIENLKKKEIEVKKEDIIPQEIVEKKCPQCGRPLQIKLGRFGKFLACTGFPECRHTEPLEETEEEKEALEEANHGKCEKCGGEMVIKEGRFGKFLACSNYPRCKNVKPLNHSIGMKCPECKKGDVVVKFTKKKKRFWGCSRYPECKWASWKDPSLEHTD